MRIFSDPHIGTNRRSHTTSESREKLKSEIFQHALTAAKGDDAVCVGDLFDKFSNAENYIVQGFSVAKECSIVVAGNHDSKNQINQTGSLDVIDQLTQGLECKVVKNLNFNTPFVGYYGSEHSTVVVIPHHISQEIFDRAIEQACTDTKGCNDAIFLHCNYENSMTEGSDISLNLTSAQADQLLEQYQYVILGHEHKPRELKGGRLVIVGNTFPTSFSDISDKYYWDLEDGHLTKTLLWDMNAHYAEIFYGEKFTIPKDVQFIDVCGTATSSEAFAVTKLIQELWENTDALMIRNNVSIKGSDNQTHETFDRDTLPAQIEKDLKESLVYLWDEYKKEL